MNPQPESSARSSQQLHDALLDYVRSPGKSNVALREPALLFASFRQILQIAAGREPEAGTTTDEERASLRRAACFFTRTALLFPGADHYTLMGLDRNFDGPDLKDHYRLLMRLIHPDFAGTLPFAWPEDAAVRVNLAYEVLSSPVRRSEYEKSLAAASKKPSPAKVERTRTALVVRKPRAGISRSRFKQLVVISSVAGTGAVLLSLQMGGQEPVHLVQRGQGPAARAKPAAERVPAAVQDSAPEVPQAEPAALAEADPAPPAQARTSPAAAVGALMSRVFTSAPREHTPVAKAAVGVPTPPPQPSNLQAATHQSSPRTDTPRVDLAPAPPVPASNAVVYLEPAPASPRRPRQPPARAPGAGVQPCAGGRHTRGACRRPRPPAGPGSGAHPGRSPAPAVQSAPATRKRFRRARDRSAGSRGPHQARGASTFAPIRRPGGGHATGAPVPGRVQGRTGRWAIAGDRPCSPSVGRADHRLPGQENGASRRVRVA